MSVQPGPIEKRYAANGVSLTYTVPFLVIEAGDLKVYLNGVLLTSGYTHTGLTLPASSITFLVPPSGDLFLQLDVPFQRLTDYQLNGDFLASTVNRDYDRIWQALKQLLGYSVRALSLGALDIDGAGWYRAKGNGIRDLVDPVNSQDAATKHSVEQYVAGILATGQGPINNAANVVFVRPSGVAGSVQDLSSTTDSTKGSALVGRVYRQVDTIAELKTLSKLGTPYVEVLEYSAGAGVINSRYHLDTTDIVSAGDDFTIVVASDGGRWRLKHPGAFTLKMAGGKEDGVTDDADAWDRLLAVSQGKEVRWPGVSVVGRPIVVPVNTLRLFATTKGATIKAKDGTNFEYTLSATNKSKLEFKGFTVDSNKAGRSGVLTTRTVSVSLVGCTDCQLTEVTGSNAIGSATIPGIGISTAGAGNRVNTTNCLALDCGVAGKAADGFFCSSSNSINTGNVSINCLDTGHVLESCSYSGIVGCVSIGCGVIGAITNAIGTDTYGNFIQGLRGQDWNASVTGGVQISALAAGNLIETSVSGLSLVGVANFIGPGVSVRRTGGGRVDGLTLECSVRNGSSQGVLIDSARNVSVEARIAGTVSACVQVMGDSDNIVISGKSNLVGGTYGVIAQNTSKVLVHGVHIKTPSSYGVYAFDTSTITSTMNDIVTPGVAYEGKDAGATLYRMTLVNGLFSLESIVAGAPITGALSSKFTVANKAGGVAGVVGLSVT